MANVRILQSSKVILVLSWKYISLWMGGDELISEGGWDFIWYRRTFCGLIFMGPYFIRILQYTCVIVKVCNHSDTFLLCHWLNLQYHVYGLHRQDIRYLGLRNWYKNQKIKRSQFVCKHLFSFKKRSTVHR